MNIVIRSQRVAISEALSAHCRARVERALRPFASQVAYVELVLVDEDGPRQGVGQTCRVSVEMKSGARIRFESSATSYYESAGQAAAGAGRHVTRWVQRRRAVTHERFWPLEAS